MTATGNDDLGAYAATHPLGPPAQAALDNATDRITRERQYVRGFDFQEEQERQRFEEKVNVIGEGRDHSLAVIESTTAALPGLEAAADGERRRNDLAAAKAELDRIDAIDRAEAARLQRKAALAATIAELSTNDVSGEGS